jgi:gliding motility-associated-like protein
MQMQLFEGANCTNFTSVSNFLETATSQTVVASGLTIGATYYIVVDGFAGDICSYTISATSGVQVAEAVATVENICLGESTDLTGIVFGTGTYTYNWTDEVGNVISASNQITVSPSISTEYILEVNGLCGSASYANIYVTVNDNPLANAGANQTICDNESATINASATNGNGNYTYTWDNGLNAGSTQTVSPITSTTYNVLVTDGNGCTDTDVITVDVNVSPSADAGLDNSICLGQTANLIANGGTLYSWTSGGTTANENVTPTTTTNYSVTVGNANNCFDTDDVTITVNALPNAFAGNDIGVCNGGSTNITATGGVSYSWSGGLGTGANQTLTNITTDATYTVTVTDINNCVSTDAITITVGSALTPDAGQDISICLGESTLLNATGGITYSWDNGPMTQSQSVSPLITTTYTVDVTDGGSCTGSNSVTITVNDNPIANAGLDQSICAGETVLLTATGGTSYVWNQALGNGEMQTVSPTSTTTYEVTVTNANNCSDMDDIVIIVNSNPAVLASQNTTICLGEFTDINATGTGIESYSWTNSNGDNLNGQNQTVSPNSTMWYYVTGINSNQCSATDSLLININTLPLIDISSVQLIDASCSNGGGTISGITVIGNPTFTYNWTNGLSSIGNTISMGGLESGSYLLTVTDANNCIDTANIAVGYIDISTVVANDDSVNTQMNTEITINVYLNDIGNVSTLNTISQPSNGYISYSGNGEYLYTPNPNFIGEDNFTYEICDNACVNACEIAAVLIAVAPQGELIVPNGFSPNGDGYNDFFTIVNLDQYENNDIVIFNRWGDKVYEASPYLNDWDGSSENAKMVVSGDKVVEGTYYFILNINEKDKEPINGFIDLRRK